MVNGIRLFFYRLFGRKVNVRNIPVKVPSKDTRARIDSLRDSRHHDEALKLFVNSTTGLLPRDVAKLSNDEIIVLVDRITRNLREIQ